MEKELNDQVAVVTGAARGIGAAVAIELARQGARVALADVLDAGSIARQITESGGTARSYRVDVTNSEEIEKLFDSAASDLGAVELVVVAAAYSLRDYFWIQPIEHARQTLEVTLWGAYLGVRAAARRFVERGKGGCIVVIGSPHAIVAEPRCMAYNMAKAGLDMMARTAAAELIPHRVRVNIVHPGWTDTPGERRYYTEEQIAELGARLPAGRLARPDEIARAVVFLASPASEYINGTTLTVDGGLGLPPDEMVG